MSRTVTSKIDEYLQKVVSATKEKNGIPREIRKGEISKTRGQGQRFWEGDPLRCSPEREELATWKGGGEEAAAQTEGTVKRRRKKWSLAHMEKQQIAAQTWTALLGADQMVNL